MSTTATNTKRIAVKHATTKLERNALAWLNEKGRDYDNGAAGAFKDLAYGGCQSGMVGHLIYTKDCVRFYARHRADINTLLCEMSQETGDSIADLFGGNKWDDTDPLALDAPNQNLLAWFGFEEAARLVARRAGIED